MGGGQGAGWGAAGIRPMSVSLPRATPSAGIVSSIDAMPRMPPHQPLSMSKEHKVRGWGVGASEVLDMLKGGGGGG